MKRVMLKENRPFMRGTEAIWFKSGAIFEVIEEKELPSFGLGYKIKDVKFGLKMDGWNIAKDFEDFEGGK